MKLYIGNRKTEEGYERALTVYGNRGKLLYSSCSKVREDEMQKFDKTLIALVKGIKEFRKLSQNGVLNDIEPLIFFIHNKTIYNWIEKEDCPSQYIDVFSELMLELSLLTNETEIIYTKTNKALFKNTNEDKVEKITDIFKF